MQNDSKISRCSQTYSIPIQTVAYSQLGGTETGCDDYSCANNMQNYFSC